MIEFIAIHIPKTAGLSFRAVLQDVYGGAAVCHLNKKQVKDGNGVSKDMLPDGTRALIGHYTFSEVSKLRSETGAPITTWLRDPVERVLSNYYFFMKRIRIGKAVGCEHRADESLLEYAAMPGNQNLMHEFLDGIALKDIDFVGITEYFDEDIKELSSLFGWTINEKPPVLNVNKEIRSQFEPPNRKALKTILKLNKKDVKLYNKALKLRRSRRLNLGLI